MRGNSKPELMSGRLKASLYSGADRSPLEHDKAIQFCIGCCKRRCARVQPRSLTPVLSIRTIIGSCKNETSSALVSSFTIAISITTLNLILFILMSAAAWAPRPCKPNSLQPKDYDPLRNPKPNVSLQPPLTWMCWKCSSKTRVAYLPGPAPSQSFARAPFVRWQALGFLVEF